MGQNQPAASNNSPASPPASLPDTTVDEAALLGVIVELVRQSTDVDLSHYKDSTFRRQLQRRMLELGLSGLEAYVDRLHQDAVELERLQRSLLISVTRFFRDTDVFSRVRDVLAELVASRPDAEGLRLWVPGCATGEEAYTLAVLVAEALGERLARCPVRLFATDIDAEAIALARQGLYPHNALDAVPAELVHRHFVADRHGVRPARHIRDMCVFAQHNLLAQPPFVNMDLISCRNVLIYFQAGVQGELMAKFHHALRPEAWLLLGQSESAGGRDGLFNQQDKHFKLFKRRNVPTPRLYELAGSSRQASPPSTSAHAALQALPSSELRFHQHLLRRHALPSVLVDADGRVLHLWGDVDRYLRLEGGKADFTLTGLCLPALRNEVRTLLHLALTAAPAELVSQAVLLPAAESPRGPGPERLDASQDDARRQARHVRLLAQALYGDAGEPLGVVIAFEESELPAAPQALAQPDSAEPTATPALPPAVQAELSALRDELAVAREHLHAMVSQLERANDDRQSLHEELQASSEELQSSNEELQASNEELTTLNEQLLAKSDELGSLNDTLLSIESSVQMAMVVVDTQLRVQRFNPLAVRIFGLLEHDVGRTLSTVPSSLPLDALPRQINAVLQSGEPLVARIDQADRHYVMQLSPLRDARGQLYGVIIGFTDVAELRQAEAERSRLAAIVIHSEDAIVGKTLDGIITSWNPAAERLFGFSAAEAIGHPMVMLFPPESRNEESLLLARLAHGETVPPFDTTRIHRNGHRLAVSVALSPIRDGGGLIVGVSKIARDISARHALEEARAADHIRLAQLVAERTQALADQQRQLQTILDGVPGMVAYWDANQCLRYANRQHRQALRHDGPDQGIGRTVEQILGDRYAAQARPHIDRVLQGQACHYEMQTPLPEGLCFQVNFVPDVAAGEVRGFIVMAFDVTTIKHAELAAEAANRAKSAFLASMSHEIRTPLNAVLGLAQLAQRRHEGEPVVDTFKLIMQAGQHLLGVINDILDFSKIEAGKLDLQQSRVDVSELIDQAVGMVGAQAQAKGLSLRVLRDPALADAYTGDPVRIAQLLINLLTNAVKFTDEGRVELILSAHEGGVLIVVSDTGAGMSPAVQQRLFTPFEQGDTSSTRRVGGTGLGLSICKRLAELMQGRISASSEPGQGSRFEVWLPLRALFTHVVEGAEPPEPSFTFAMARAQRLSGLRVLVAEDHPVNQIVLEELLKIEGAEMIVVDNGAQAVEQVQQHGPGHFQLVLCDIEMPVMDGYEATSRMRALAPRLPIIGLTAHAFDDARQRGQAAGMNGYITKPYMVDALVAEVHATLVRMSQGLG